MKCPLCDGPVANGRCTRCGMPYRNDAILYHLNESRSDHYKHATPQARKIMTGQQSRQTVQTSKRVQGQNTTRKNTQGYQNQKKAGSKPKKKGGKILAVIILISVLSGVIPGIVEVVRQLYDEYKYSQSWEQTDTEEAVQEVYGTDEDSADKDSEDKDSQYFSTWTDEDSEYFAIDPGYGTVEVAEGNDIEPGSYIMFTLSENALKICIVSGNTEETYDVEGTGAVENLELEEGDEIIFQEYSETTDTLYLVKDRENK